MAAILFRGRWVNAGSVYPLYLNMYCCEQLTWSSLGIADLLKMDSCYDAIFVIAGVTTGCRHDNLGAISDVKIGIMMTLWIFSALS